MEGYHKSNYAIFFTDTILFVNAMAFLSINTIIPYFLYTLGATTFHVGLASALVGAGAFISQPLFVKRALSLAFKAKSFARILYMQRFVFLLFIASIPVFAKNNPGITIGLFLISWGIFNYFVGSYMPFFSGLFSKTIPDIHRGRQLGYSGAAANILALGTSYLIGFLLKNISFPYNYTIIFGLGIFLLFLDAFDLSLIKEPPDLVDKSSQMSYFQYIRMIPRILSENRAFKKMVTGFSLFVVANVSLAYYTLYSIRKYDAQAGEVALFTAIGIAINILGSMLYGNLADKKGHRMVLQIASVLGFTASILIFAVHNVYGVIGAFALSTLCAGGFQLSSSVMIMQSCPQEKIPVFISINVMITLAISSAVTLTSSLIIDYISFEAIFIITGLAALGAYIVFLYLNRGNVKKPRLNPGAEMYN